jgi:hypothetical protein
MANFVRPAILRPQVTAGVVVVALAPLAVAADVL